MILDNRNDRTYGSLRGLFFAGLFFAVLLCAPAAFADSIPGLSEMQFRTELIGMTRAYDKDVTLQQAERNPYIYERLIVKTYDSSLDPEEYGAVDAIRDTDGHYILQFDSPFAARRAERRLRKKDSVLYVEPDLPVYVQGNTTAARKLQASDYWGAAYTGCDVYADYIQQKGVSGNTKVAVVDSGVRKTHELFRGRIDSSREKDYVNNDRNAADDLGHGTNVAGIIAECSPGLDQLDIIPIKVIDNNGDGSSAVIAQAVKDLAGIRKGKKHCFADVINLSCTSENRIYHSNVLKEEIRNAVRAGAVVVISAGNQGDNAGYHPPANITDREVPGCIVVSSCGKNGKHVVTSNYGSSVDLCAPGEDVVTAHLTSDHAYKKTGGTSFSAPCTAAAAAMQRLLYPDRKPKEVERILKQKCVNNFNESVSRHYGTGILDLSAEVPAAYYEKIQAVISAIAVIPSDVTLESEPLAEAARGAYDGLSQAQKRRVTNYQVLADAEKQIARLKDLEGEAKKEEEARRAAEEAKKAEEARKAAEEAKKAEKARRKEEKRRAAEEAKKAEEARRAEEAKKAQKITIPKAPSCVKTKTKKNKVTVSWKKIAKKDRKLRSGVRSVQVQYAADRAFSRNVKTKAVGRTKTKAVLKLRKKGVYYIRVRYRGKDGVSRWSGIRRVTIR